MISRKTAIKDMTYRQKLKFFTGFAKRIFNACEIEATVERVSDIEGVRDQIKHGILFKYGDRKDIFWIRKDTTTGQVVYTTACFIQSIVCIGPEEK